MTPLDGFVERHRLVWQALSEAGFGTSRSGPVLETGHGMVVYFAQEKGQWFARVYEPGGEREAVPYLLWLGGDDEKVPERLRQELARPEVMEYLRAAMR